MIAKRPFLCRFNHCYTTFFSVGRVLERKFINMKIAYIAHPISGDIEGNLKRIEQIGRQINLEEPEVVPFAHYFFDCYTLDDDIPKERERGIKNNIALIRKGFIDEVRLYGNRISTGMSHEVDLAIELGVDVIPMTKATKREFSERWQNVV